MAIHIRVTPFSFLKVAQFRQHHVLQILNNHQNHYLCNRLSNPYKSNTYERSRHLHHQT